MTADLPAIVLTLDAQAGLARLAIARWLTRWVDARLRFRVPTAGGANAERAWLVAEDRVDLVPAPPDIPGSMAALLEGVDDDAFVFWCIDDRYVIDVLAPATLEALPAFLTGRDADDLDGVKLFRWKEPLAGDGPTIGGTVFHLQPPGTIWGFWHHHVLRARWLRRVFLDGTLEPEASILDVNPRLAAALAGSRILVPATNVVTFGEPLVAGALTVNGVEALEAEGCAVPAYPRGDVRVTFERTPDDPARASKFRT